MGREARAGSRHRQEILAKYPTCIYCGERSAEIEHMPPRTMFLGKQRPSGMEFGVCKDCNQGTSAADLVASFYARLTSDASETSPTTIEATDRFRKLRVDAPGVLEELFDPRRETMQWWNDGGVFRPMTVVNNDGPITKAYLRVFAAKFAMALYAQHVGEALPTTGMVRTRHHMNAGLSQKTAETFLSVMPGISRLQQRRFTSERQFDYAYNTDERSVVMALASFHSGLHVFCIATSTPELFELDGGEEIDNFFSTRPGQLLDLVPRKIRRPKNGRT